MKPQESQYQDLRLKENKCGEAWGDYTPGTAAAEDDEIEMVIAGDIRTDDVIRRISAEDTDFSNNIVGFEWVAGTAAFREWMHTLQWQAPTHTIGWEETYKLVYSKVGVVCNLRQNAGFKAKEG